MRPPRYGRTGANPLVDVDRHAELSRVVIKEVVVHAQIQTAAQGSSEGPAFADEERRSVAEASDKRSDICGRHRGAVGSARRDTGGGYQPAVTSQPNLTVGIDRNHVVRLDVDSGVHPLTVSAHNNGSPRCPQSAPSPSSG